MEMEEFKEIFVSEGQEQIRNMKKSIADLAAGAGVKEDNLDEIRRSAHTLKGNSAILSYTEMSDLARQVELFVSGLAKTGIRTEDLRLLEEGTEKLSIAIDLYDKGKHEEFHEKDFARQLMHKDGNQPV